jgi:hypothetical protein
MIPLRATLKSFRFSFLLFYHSHGSLLAKASATARHLPVYHYHTKLQMQTHQENWLHYRSHSTEEGSKTVQRYKEIMKRYF